MSGLEKSDSISMGRKSNLPSSQDRNNALIWNGARRKNNHQGLYLRDQLMHPKNEKDGEVHFGGLKIPIPCREVNR
jgi:hypothetical protein